MVLLVSGWLVGLVLIRWWIMVFIVWLEMLVFFRCMVKKCFSLKVLCGVCRNLLVVMCEMVDLCMLIFLVIFFRVSGVIVFLFCIRKVVWCLMIICVVCSRVLQCIDRSWLNQCVFCSILCSVGVVLLVLVSVCLYWLLIEMWWLVVGFSVIFYCLLVCQVMMFGIIIVLCLGSRLLLGCGCSERIRCIVLCMLLILVLCCWVRVGQLCVVSVLSVLLRMWVVRW